MNWALIVGLNEYPERTGQTPLKGAVADAAAFAEWALEAGGGDVDPERLYFWTHPAPPTPGPLLAQSIASPTRPEWKDQLAPTALAHADFTRAPTRSTIVETAFHAANLARSQHPGEAARLYVFFAGHGVRSNMFESTIERQTCFITGDFGATNVIAEGVLPCEDFRRALLAERFQEVLMFLDCCRSDMARLNQRIAPLIDTANNEDEDLLWIVGHAAKPRKLAYEVPEEAPARGAFSTALLAGLRTERNANGELTLLDLSKYVTNTITPIVHPRTQAPQFVTENPSDHIVLLTSPAALAAKAAIVVAFAAATPADAQFILRDRDTAIVATFTPATFMPSAHETGRPYSLECSQLAIAIAFDHPGPGATRVET